MRTEQIDYPQEFATTVESFKRAVGNRSTLTEASMAERLVAILNTGIRVNAEDLSNLTIFLLPLYDSMMRTRLTVELLTREDVPAEALTAACRCRNAKYRGVAVKHPMCPEEDRVYAVLAGIEVLPPWV